jgi:hypothetical protein
MILVVALVSILGLAQPGWTADRAAGMGPATGTAGQELSAAGAEAPRDITYPTDHPDLRWSNFPFYRLVTEGYFSDEVLAELNAGKLPVPQQSGSKNSLGLGKLIFPDTDNLYRHGTDEPKLFSRTVRDFRHGRIRAQKHADLAAWASLNNPGRNPERVQASMQETEEPVDLATTICLLIIYGTAALDDFDHIHFLDDIYDDDAELEHLTRLSRAFSKPARKWNSVSTRIAEGVFAISRRPELVVVRTCVGSDQTRHSDRNVEDASYRF